MNTKKSDDKIEISEGSYRVWSLALQALIPLAVLWVGAQVQSTIAGANVAQQYTAMAIDILQQPSEETSDELRIWAATTVEEYSPVKMSDALLASLMQRGIDVPMIIVRVPQTPDWLMEPPKLYPENEKVTYGEILVDYAYERDRMIALQKFLAEMEANYGTTEGLQDELEEVGKRLEAEWEQREDQVSTLEAITKPDSQE